MCDPAARVVPTWRRGYTWWRYMAGRYQYAVDTRLARWLAAELVKNPFERGYSSRRLRAKASLWRGAGAHARSRQSDRTHPQFPRSPLPRIRALDRLAHLGHPSQAMVERVEKEYHLANRIRVASVWAKRDLVARGVDERKVFVATPAIDLKTFTPPLERIAATGPLRVVFVGSFFLGKGFQYLLRAAARIGAGRCAWRWSARPVTHGAIDCCTI